MRTRNILSLVLLFAAVVPLGAFRPQERHFSSTAQWTLFTAWEQNGGMYSTESAVITRQSIEMRWKSETLEQADVVFELENGLVARLRERLPEPGDAALNQAAATAETAWFILQARRPEALAPLLAAGLCVRYGSLVAQAALDSLFAEYPSGRLPVYRPHAEADGGMLAYVFPMPGGHELTLAVPANPAALERLRAARPTPAPAPAPIPVPAPVPAQPIAAPAEPETAPTEQPAPQPACTEPTRVDTLIATSMDTPLEELTLSAAQQPGAPATFFGLPEHIDQQRMTAPLPPHTPTTREEIDRTAAASPNVAVYVDALWNRPFSRELLNNKITDVQGFLAAEFPRHTLRREDEAWVLRHTDGPDALGASIRVRRVPRADATDIVPDDTATLHGGRLLLPDGGEIDLGALSPEQAETLAPQFIQLTYLHRALGTRLTNFLLLPDVVATTLVVKGEERRIYEPRNYFQLLLLLDRWWRGRTVYFAIRDVKIVNNHVEFRGHLFALDDNGRGDYAEIRFHLDNDLHLDLAMMFLYPNVSTTDEPTETAP